MSGSLEQTPPGYVWLCTNASPPEHPWVSCAWKNAGRKGFERFVRCGFETTDAVEALEHSEQTGHWIEEYPNGNRNEKPRRDIHASDEGFSYVSVH